jgi:TetR/AcrR family transcriptional regulator, transcriptional repressor for nem operon
LPDSVNVSDSGPDLTSRARSARNASALRWQTISGRRLCPSEHLPHRICDNAPKGTFYNYFRSKEDLASRLVDRQFEALRESLSRSTGHSASHQLTKHCNFLAIEPPMIEVAPLQLLATLAAEAPAIPVAVTQRIARGTEIWITHVSDLISLAQKESGTPIAHDPQKLASLLVTCWYGAIVRRKSDPSLKLLDDFLPFFIRSGVP